MIAVCDVAPPEVGDEGGERMLLEQDHVGGRELARDEDGGVLARGLHGDAPLGAGERFKDALGHLPHVFLALAQVRIVDLVELRGELVELHAERPLRVAVALADELARRLRECGVVEQHDVHLHEGRELRSRPVAHAVGELLHLVAHFLHRAVVAALLARHVGGGDLVVVDLGGHAEEEVGMADGDAARHADAVHREARGGRALVHGLSPLPELVGEELLQRVHRGLLVVAVGLDLDRRAHARGEHHHAHDALRVHAPAVAGEPDAAAEPGGELRELGRGARVQSELVHDGHVLLDHAGPAFCGMRATPSTPPERALSRTTSRDSLR